MIIESQKNGESFLSCRRIEFDSVVIPEEINWEEIEKALSCFFEQHSAENPEKYQYIRQNIDSYNKEFSGFLHKGRGFIFCNMFTYDNDFSFFDDEPAEPDFSSFMDGGIDVVFFIFDTDDKKIVTLEWNGEA